MPDLPTPRDWGEAFAALPAETPPADSWARVATRLDARAAPARWPRWLAVAAVLAIAVALPCNADASVTSRYASSSDNGSTRSV